MTVTVAYGRPNSLAASVHPHETCQEKIREPHCGAKPTCKHLICWMWGVYTIRSAWQSAQNKFSFILACLGPWDCHDFVLLQVYPSIIKFVLATELASFKSEMATGRKLSVFSSRQLTIDTQKWLVIYGRHNFRVHCPGFEISSSFQTIWLLMV